MGRRRMFVFFWDNRSCRIYIRNLLGWVQFVVHGMRLDFWITVFLGIQRIFCIERLRLAFYRRSCRTLRSIFSFQYQLILIYQIISLFHNFSKHRRFHVGLVFYVNLRQYFWDRLYIRRLRCQWSRLTFHIPTKCVLLPVGHVRSWQFLRIWRVFWV